MRGLTPEAIIERAEQSERTARWIAFAIVLGIIVGIVILTLVLRSAA